MTEPLKPSVTLGEIADAYAKRVTTNKLHAVVVGQKGNGKTQLITTCPFPTLVFSFDPGGSSLFKSKFPHLLERTDEYPDGKVIIDLYEEDEIDAPDSYKRFRKNFSRYRKNGVFEQVKTVILDTMSVMSQRMIWQIMKKEGRPLAGIEVKSDKRQHGMQIQDYDTVLNWNIIIANQMATLPCHTIITSHMKKDKDELTGALDWAMALPGQSQTKVPEYVPDFYYLSVDGMGKRILNTAGSGSFHGSTKLNLDAEEPADITHIIKKAGLEL